MPCLARTVLLSPPVPKGGTSPWQRRATSCRSHGTSPVPTVVALTALGRCLGRAPLGTRSTADSTTRPHPSACSRGAGPPRPYPLLLPPVTPCTALGSAPRTVSTSAPTHTCRCPCHCPSNTFPPAHCPCLSPCPRPCTTSDTEGGGREGWREEGMGAWGECVCGGGFPRGHEGRGSCTSEQLGMQPRYPDSHTCSRFKYPVHSFSCLPQNQSGGVH